MKDFSLSQAIAGFKIAKIAEGYSLALYQAMKAGFLVLFLCQNRLLLHLLEV